MAIPIPTLVTSEGVVTVFWWQRLPVEEHTHNLFEKAHVIPTLFKQL
jgi:hypothetical protein